MENNENQGNIDIFGGKPATLEEINDNWDAWWNQLSDSNKARLAAEAEYFMKENITKLPGPWN